MGYSSRIRTAQAGEHVDSHVLSHKMVESHALLTWTSAVDILDMVEPYQDFQKISSNGWPFKCSKPLSYAFFHSSKKKSAGKSRTIQPEAIKGIDISIPEV